MKVLLINTLYYPNSYGGAEKSVQLLAEYLAKKGVEVVVVSISETDGIAEVNGVRIYYIKLANLYWQWRIGAYKRIKPILNPLWHTIDTINPIMAARVEKILDRERPDLVNTNNILGFSAFIWKVIKDKGIPLVHTLRDYYLICPKTLMFNKRRLANCEGQCFSCQVYSMPRFLYSYLVDHVVGISQFIIDRHIEYGFFEKTPRMVVYNPSLMESGATPIEQIAGFKSQKRGIRFGYIGRIEPSKGIAFLLESFTALSSSDASLTIAGNCESKFAQQLQMKFTRPGITFLGFTKVQDFMHQIDVLIVPSMWNEPFGRVIIEAYSIGKPVVTCRVGGIPELVDEGRTGFLFDLCSQQQLINYLNLFIKNPELTTSMRENCLRKAEQFSSSATSKEYLHLYHRMLA